MVCPSWIPSNASCTLLTFLEIIFWFVVVYNPNSSILGSSVGTAVVSTTFFGVQQSTFICKSSEVHLNKYDYSKHIEASKMEDMTIEEQREKFKDNVENEKNKQQPKKVKYSFKDF